MLRLTTLVILAYSVALSGQALAAPQGINAGKWAFNVEYDLIGIPQTFPGYTLQECLSEEKPFPSISRPGDECEMNLQGRFGSLYTWTLNCSDDWEMVQGMGRIDYNGESAAGDAHLQIVNPHNAPQMMEFRIQGKRQGNC